MTPYEMKRRIEHLEELVETLYRRLDMSPPPPSQPDPLDPVRDLAQQGKTIQAIKLYREITGSRLKDAKAAVERM